MQCIVVKRQETRVGQWVELLRDSDPHLVQRTFDRSQVLRNPELRDAFESATPHSRDVLLHYAGDPPPGSPVREAPVVLTHGAKVDGHFWWRGQDGLAPFLRAQGFQVFAVTFPHNQDDNFQQVQQLAHATDRVQTLTRAPAVDLVGHSKGGISACILASPTFPRQHWMVPYRGNVRRCLELGVPLAGIDFFHRHPDMNLESAQGSNNWPMSWTTMREGDQRVDYRARAYNDDPLSPWRGQVQLLSRWDHTHPLAPQPDVEATYFGGKTAGFDAEGIERHIEAGGRFIEHLQKSPVAAEVPLYLLAGNKADLHLWANETTGPSDGIIFVDSALAAPPGSRVAARDVLPLNHLDLACDRQGQAWVLDHLSAR